MPGKITYPPITYYKLRPILKNLIREWILKSSIFCEICVLHPQTLFTSIKQYCSLSAKLLTIRFPVLIPIFSTIPESCTNGYSSFFFSNNNKGLSHNSEKKWAVSLYARAVVKNGIYVAFSKFVKIHKSITMQLFHLNKQSLNTWNIMPFRFC